MVGILGGAFAGAVVFDQMVENRGRVECSTTGLWFHFHTGFHLMGYCMANS